MSSLAGARGSAHNPGVEQSCRHQAELPLHPQDEVECRRCEVHCDKVVYPGACIERSCPFVYAYEAWGHTYVGCMQKVYDVEIDLDLLRAAEARRDGFGAVRRRAAADVQRRGRGLLRGAATISAAATRSSTSSRRAAELPRDRSDHAEVEAPST